MKNPRILMALAALVALACCAGSGADEAPDPTPDPPPAPVEGDCVTLRGGRFYDPEGQELALWGVNLQPCISWEWNDRLKRRGIPQTAEALCAVAERNLDEVARLGATVVRCHLTPADFTDADGNLVETPYLKALDCMVAGAARRGIYVTLALVNHMGSGCVEESVFRTASREDWVHDPAVVEKTRRYAAQLLGRRNPLSGTTYAAERYIAMWELINEPALYGWNDLKSHAAASEAFAAWLQGRPESEELYALYREELVRSYIDQMVGELEKAGARQPVIWSHNWPRYRPGNADIFRGVLASKADAVSCCNYPGQDLVPQDYWNSPVDLSGEDYAGWFNRYFDEQDGYGWMLLPEYASKGKTVYEFETFFNQSAYLYPIQAQYFRALGVQCATMWTYTMQEYAPYHAGSHFLSLTCTPRKAASFIVAGEIFRSTPLGSRYDRLLNEQIGSDFAISKSRDLAIYASGERFCHSGDVTEWCPIEVSDRVRSIAGVGSSPLVTYSGTGIYFIDERDGELWLTLEPDHRWMAEPWNNQTQGTVSALDFETPHPMTIRLAAWAEGPFTLYRVESGARVKAGVYDRLEAMPLAPGDYVVVRGDK